MKKILAVLLVSLVALLPAVLGQPVVATKVNSTIYVVPSSGTDLGAQINAAAATCAPGSQCQIVVPPGTQTQFATGIIFLPNETITCPSVNVIDNTTNSDSAARLSYIGSGVAVTMSASAGRFIGCDLLLGTTTSTAAGGVFVSGHSNQVIDVGVRGGASTTTLIHVGSASNPTEDSHIERVRLSDWVGPAISIDHANDTFITNTTSYGKVGNTTGVGMLVDASAGGIIISDYVCGNCGLHGLWERYTLTGNYPSFIFATDFECDEAQSDCFLFDSTLASANVDATFIDSWAAGAVGVGVHISGGSGITFNSCHVRVNSLDGFLIDVTGGSAEYATIINGCLIQGNNQSNAANLSGIRMTGHPGPVIVTSNQITNFPEVGGNQKYALDAQSDVEGLTFSNNVCSRNVTGCLNVGAVTASKLTYSGNVDTTTGPPASFFPGTLTVIGQITENSGLNVTQTVGSGTVMTAGTAIAAGTSQGQTGITISGATTSDVAHCSLNAAPVSSWQTGIQLLPPVVTANTVTVWLSNPTAGAITPAATIIRCTVTR